jgi:hypothetical protein
VAFGPPGCDDAAVVWPAIGVDRGNGAVRVVGSPQRGDALVLHVDDPEWALSALRRVGDDPPAGLLLVGGSAVDLPGLANVVADLVDDGAAVGGVIGPAMGAATSQGGYVQHSGFAGLRFG